MESSPVSETSKMEVELCTPTENLNKHCQEITPDNPTQPNTKPLLGEKKVSAVGFSQKLSKRKLFWQPVDQTSGFENVSEPVNKKKKSDDAIKNVTNENQRQNGSDCPTVKRLLTERQQLAFLLEATSSHAESLEDDNDGTFTKIKSHKRIKRNGKCVKARVYRRNERGETPLHLAAIKGDVGSLKKLLKDGAEVGVKDYAGWTALHEACNHGNLAAAKLLVKHGAQVNVPGFEGDTPLHDAVVNNHVEVVNMLLSCCANPHQTNTRRKKPTDLINTKEMSDIFNLRGVQHTFFEKKDTKTLNQDVVISGKMEKTPNSDNERLHMRGSILGNEIQRKETQGESKMEKPVMYICKLEPRNEELTIRTTQVTSYNKCSNVQEGGGGETKDIASEGYKEQGHERDTLLDINKKDQEEKVQLSTESFPPRHKDEVQSGVVLKDGPSSHQVESRRQTEVNEITKNKITVMTSDSGDLKTGTQDSEISGNEQQVSISDQDKVNRNTKGKLFGSEELSSRSQGTELSETSEVKTKIGPPSLTPGFEDLPPAESREKFSTQVHVERHRTPEIDESIALEVLSTGLFSGGFSQYFGTFSGRQQDIGHSSYIHRDVSLPDGTSSGRQQDMGHPSYISRDVSLPDGTFSGRQQDMGHSSYISRDVSLPDGTSSGRQQDIGHPSYISRDVSLPDGTFSGRQQDMGHPSYIHRDVSPPDGTSSGRQQDMGHSSYISRDVSLPDGTSSGRQQDMGHPSYIHRDVSLPDGTFSGRQQDMGHPSYIHRDVSPPDGTSSGRQQDTGHPSYISRDVSLPDGTFSGRQQDIGHPSYIHRDVSPPDGTSSGRQQDMGHSSYISRDVSLPDGISFVGQQSMKNAGYIYRDVSAPDIHTSFDEDLIEQETSEQSSVSNDERFLDVEGLEPDLKEYQPSLEVRKHLSNEEQQIEQENVISSTSNDSDDPKEILPNKDNAKTMQGAADYPESMIVSILMNENSTFPAVAESGNIRKLSKSHGNVETYSYGEANQSHTLATSKLDDQSASKFISENIALTTERSKKITIPGRFSGIEHTDLTSWKYNDTTSEKDGRYGKGMATKNTSFTEEPSSKGPAIRGVHNVDDLRPWQVEKKSRGRKKVALIRNSTFTREDKISRRKTGQPISSSHQENTRSWDTRVGTGNNAQPWELHNSQSSKERLAFGINTAVMKPSKPTVSWQSLMAAGRCRLAELGIPGYDQFLMKTKQYELASNAHQEKAMEEPAHSTLTEENMLSLKHKKSKEELLRKQRSEQDKLQLCMEQEVVRFYTKQAYSSLKCNQPPGVCSAIYWQNISKHQLQNEKKKLSQKHYLEEVQTSPSDHQEIIDKYENLKSLMANRHKHEQQSLDAAIKRELQRCV